MEFDHADIFNSIDDIKNEFAQALPRISGEVIYNDEYPAIKELRQDFDKQNTWIEYGHHSNSGPKDVKRVDGKTEFSLEFNGEELGFKTSVIGEHNILNITSCLLLLLKEGFSAKNLQVAIDQLGLVKRRQEYRGKYKGSIVIDDFAHHPRAIDLTIDAIREAYPNKNIVTIFEPISATARSQIFQKEFENSLAKSDEVILAVNPLKTTVAGGSNLDCELIAQNLNEKNIVSATANSLDELQQRIDKASGEENLLLILSNKTCLGLWESDFVKSLS